MIAGPSVGTFDAAVSYSQEIRVIWCQLKVLPAAGRRLSVGEKARSYVYKQVHCGRRVACKLWEDPALLVRKVQRVLRGTPGAARPAASEAVTHRLGLQPGDSVLVKTKAEILATLDEHHSCEGMGYMAHCMDRYCGGRYQVLKRVDRFFDERTQRMLKMKNTVLLDRVYCEPEPQAEERIAGCQRMCFLFWKEAWLERVEPGPKMDQ
jgi:hypothetical protein